MFNTINASIRSYVTCLLRETDVQIFKIPNSVKSDK